tara:strand:+ start:713 stop:1714 length:1002 start_codon:yes stop_codon:yes gene_type:complete
MNYQEFLQSFGYEDSPFAKETYQESVFPGYLDTVKADLGFTAGDHGPGYTRLAQSQIDQKIGQWPIGTGASLNVPGSHDAALQNPGIYSGGTPRLSAYQGPTGRDLYQAPNLTEMNDTPFTHHPLTGEPATGDPLQEFGPRNLTGLKGEEIYLRDLDRPSLLGRHPYAAGYKGVASAAPQAVPTGASGYASLDAAAGQGWAGTGASEALAADTAAAGAADWWGGPQAFAVNTAANLIPTRDREKIDTPLGDQGSASGYLKGGIKGAATGASIGSMVPVVGTTAGAIGGGILGVVGAGQGYFDSTSAPMISMSRIKRRGGGMPGGLLGGGAMYG